MFIFNEMCIGKVKNSVRRKKSGTPSEIENEVSDDPEIKRAQKELFDYMGNVRTEDLKPNWIKALWPSGYFTTECGFPLNSPEEVSMDMFYEGIVRFIPFKEDIERNLIKGVMRCGNL